MNLGIIGAGGRAIEMYNTIRSLDLGVRLSIIADPDPKYVKSLLSGRGIDTDAIKFCPDADSLLSCDDLDGVLVGTRCSLHTEMAIKVMARGLPLFLEKPVATNENDLEKLRKANLIYKSPVLVSFPLRLTPIVQRVKQIIDSGMIGKVEHVQAVNNVDYGGVYFHTWYREERETGGLFLQKATHDIDYINYLLGYKPQSVCAVSSKQIFKGNKPADLKCKDCDERMTCPESDFNLNYKRGRVLGDYCCFAENNGNSDSDAMIITYDTGMHAVYTQNFVVRHYAAHRGARLIGYDGTVDFNWCGDVLNFYSHNDPRKETITFHTAAMDHSGGDRELAINFINIMKGTEESRATLLDGIISAEICLAAKRAAKTKTYQDIKDYSEGF